MDTTQRPCYRLRNIKRPELFAMGRTTDGAAALLLFSCTDAAHRFLVGRNLTAECEIEELTHPQVAEWFREALDSGTASEFSRDPPGEAGVTNFYTAPIFAFLVEWQ